MATILNVIYCVNSELPLGVLFYFQIQLLMKLGKQSLATVTMAKGFLLEVSKALSSEKVEKAQFPSQTYQQQSSGNHGNQAQSVASVTELDMPITLTTSGDLASLDISPTKELEIAESTSDGVKLSVWLQWTLPKCEFRFYLNGKQGRLAWNSLCIYTHL